MNCLESDVMWYKRVYTLRVQMASPCEHPHLFSLPTNFKRSWVLTGESTVQQLWGANFRYFSCTPQTFPPMNLLLLHAQQSL